MSTRKSEAGKFYKQASDFAPEAKLTRVKLYKLMSKDTGYSEADIRKVILSFHRILCDEFSSGKEVFFNTPFYTLYIQKKKGRAIKGFTGEEIIIPDMNRVFFRPGSALNIAVGWVNAKTRVFGKIKKGQK